VDLYPVFLHLRDRQALLVGGGKVASGKLDALLAAGARVTVVARASSSRSAGPASGSRSGSFRRPTWTGSGSPSRRPAGVNREVARAAEERQVSSTPWTTPIPPARISAVC